MAEREMSESKRCALVPPRPRTGTRSFRISPRRTTTHGFAASALATQSGAAACSIKAAPGRKRRTSSTLGVMRPPCREDTAGGVPIYTAWNRRMDRRFGPDFERVDSTVAFGPVGLSEFPTGCQARASVGASATVEHANARRAAHHHRGLQVEEQPVAHHTVDALEGAMDLARVRALGQGRVHDHSAVVARRTVAPRASGKDLGDARQRGGPAERDQLDGHRPRGAQSRDELRLLDHDDPPARGQRHQLLADQGSASALDHLALRVHLVRAVDHQVEDRVVFEADQRETEPPPGLDRFLRGSGAAHAHLAPGQGLERGRGPAPGPVTDHHPVLDELRGALACGLSLCIVVHTAPSAGPECRACARSACVWRSSAQVAKGDLAASRWPGPANPWPAAACLRFYSAEADLISTGKGAVPVSSHPSSGSAKASADRFRSLASAAAARASDRSAGLPSATTYRPLSFVL